MEVGRLGFWVYSSDLIRDIVFFLGFVFWVIFYFVERVLRFLKVWKLFLGGNRELMKIIELGSSRIVF